MKSPKDMNIIQIEITNFCDILCSNCTRFCGHQKKFFFMDFDTFKEAVDSVTGFSGVVGIMGGEPTFHPEFEKFSNYFKDHFGDIELRNFFRYPVKDFMEHISTNSFLNFNLKLKSSAKRGLWSSIGKGYYKHFETIQNVFDYQCLNDHINPSTHLSLMITRKELGIPDREWLKRRDNCWIQNEWSASVTPKGAFFCEIAAALDYLFDGPGGWPIEKGWWLRKPKDFKDQLHWCEWCSAPLLVPKRNAKEGIDDMSPIWYEKLKSIDSPKLKKGLYKIFDTGGYDKNMFSAFEGYLEDNGLRMSEQNKSLNPKKIYAILYFPENPAKERIKEISENNIKNGVNEFSVITKDDNVDSKRLLDSAEISDWILMVKDGVVPNGFISNLFLYIFNPGCLYLFKNRKNDNIFYFFNVKAKSLRNGFNLLNIEERYYDGKIINLALNDNHDFEIYLNGKAVERPNKNNFFLYFYKILKILINKPRLIGKFLIDARLNGFRNAYAKVRIAIDFYAPGFKTKK